MLYLIVYTIKLEINYYQLMDLLNILFILFKNY